MTGCDLESTQIHVFVLIPNHTQSYVGPQSLNSAERLDTKYKRATLPEMAKPTSLMHVAVPHLLGRILILISY